MDLLVGIGLAANDMLRITADIIIRWLPSFASVFLGLGGQDATNVQVIGALESPLPAPYVPNTLDLISHNGEFESLYHAWTLFVAVSIAISLIELAIVIYAILGTRRIRIRERDERRALVHSVESHDVSQVQLRWNRVLELAGSEDEHDWRIAILEADIMLSELLDSLGYKGETLGEKMHDVPKGAFNTIDDAWAAHKVRNEVAHGGEAYPLSARDTRAAITRYERVFREHGLVS